MIKVQDIKPGDVYLANHYFNSKQITFQPCRIISGEVVKNQNGYDAVEVEFWNGSTKKVFVREGEFKDRLGKATLKPIGNWVVNETKKMRAHINELEKNINKITEFIK